MKKDENTLIFGLTHHLTLNDREMERDVVKFVAFQHLI